MYKAVHHDGQRLLVNNADYLRKHNIVYKSPAYNGSEGMPIGNGDMGGMLFHTPCSIEFPINKTDVINFGKDGNFDAWSWQAEEENTAPVSCGKISISDGMPSFDWVYLEKFNQTLSLGDGCVFSESKTEFSEYKVKSYVAGVPSVVVFEIESKFEEPIETTIKLEKWSSPNFFHYYEQIKDTKGRHPMQATVGEQDGCVYIQQDLNGTNYIIAMKAFGDEGTVKITNSRCCELVFPKATSRKIKLIATVVTGHGQSAKLEDAVKNINEANLMGDELFASHKNSWHDFWSKSFIALNEEEDYLENIYYMNLYQLNSCSRGEYPITFAGIWNWFKDARNWGHFYHWNHQQTYWGVYTSNHAELSKNYLDYRFKMLENAKEDASNLFGSKGAYYSDVSSLNGYNSLEPDTVKNFTVGPQIALDFYRCYQYNKDEKFLIKKAFPMMKACADLYCDVLKKGDDGVYRITGGATSYESYWNLKETSTDCGTIKMLLSALLDIKDIVGLESGVTELYEDILSNIYKLRTTTLSHDGQDMEILSVGTKWNDESVEYCEGDYPWSPFPASELAVVYPTGLISLAQKDSELFNLARNTARVIFDYDVYGTSKMGTSGHAVMPEVAARLGMTEDCLNVLNKYVDSYQVFPNGLTHFADIRTGQFWSNTFIPRVISDEKTTSWEKVHEKKIGKRVELQSDMFLQNYFESAGNIMTGTNEMLLQSHDMVIRLFPATPEGYTAIFTLLATGGFLVTSEIKEGEIRFAAILSQVGGRCSLYTPWGDEAIVVTCDKKAVEYSCSDGIISFDTKKGKNYLITRAEYPLENYYKDIITSEENTEPKKFRNNILGKQNIY